MLECALASLHGMKHFEELKPFLAGAEQRVPYARLAADLGMSEGAVKEAIHRLRRRFAQSLREEIARTVASPAQIEEELRYLLTVIRD